MVLDKSRDRDVKRAANGSRNMRDMLNTLGYYDFYDGLYYVKNNKCILEFYIAFMGHI